MTSLSRPRLSLAALAVYLAVHVGAGALHHHSANGAPPASTAVGDSADFQFQVAGPVADEDGDDACLVCSVLHLSRALPPAVQVDAVAALVGNAVPIVPFARRHSLETATHSRAPPHLS